MAQFLISGFADEVSPDLQKQIEALKRNGIGYLEPRNIDGGIIKKTDEELYAIRARLDEAGIGISSLGSPMDRGTWQATIHEAVKSRTQLSNTHTHTHTHTHWLTICPVQVSQSTNIS